MSVNDSGLVLKSISDLLGEVFVIPSYQRGYRWKKSQVKNLLDDIWEFRTQSENKSKDVFYCLQPLIVSKIKNTWTLVDGQQRITTIYLILTYLNKKTNILGNKKYKLKYQTRPDVEVFLDNIGQTQKYDDCIRTKKKYDNIDYYYMAEAYKTIEEWFNKEDEDEVVNVKLDISKTILNNNDTGKNVRFIWYEVVDKNANECFINTNAGKIPLTNSELIKSWLLKKVNFNDQRNIYLKQLEIAVEWDRIENTLQDDKFWYFISTDLNKYDARIEFIFDLMVGKKSTDEDNFTFYKFQEEFEVKSIDAIWSEVKQYFMTIEQWYNNSEFYHLIGYLIHSKFDLSINSLVEKSWSKTKTDFKECLKNFIEKQLKEVVIRELKYKDEHLKDVLLLFNIQTIINNKKSNIRFPFDEYKKENWDIEHIRSIQSDKPDGLVKQKKWLNNIFEYCLGYPFSANQEILNTRNEIKKLTIQLLRQDKFSDCEFNQVYNLVLGEFSKNSEDSLISSISNLTLLDAHTNRGCKNADFPIKRNRIIENDKKGSFVPICTKNVFLKYYSKKSDGLLFWQSTDAGDYLDAINETLKVYTSTNNKPENN